LNKLTIINSPLRVLITYPHGNSTRYLNDYLKVIEDADTFNDFSSKRKILVIFGELEDEHITWYFHQYFENKFTTI